MYKKYSGTEIKDGEQEYILIKAEDILAIVKQEVIIYGKNC